MFVLLASALAKGIFSILYHYTLLLYFTTILDYCEESLYFTTVLYYCARALAKSIPSI